MGGLVKTSRYNERRGALGREYRSRPATMCKGKSELRSSLEKRMDGNLSYGTSVFRRLTSISRQSQLKIVASLGYGRVVGALKLDIKAVIFCTDISWSCYPLELTGDTVHRESDLRVNKYISVPFGTLMDE
jgi:hypothetical protein